MRVGYGLITAQHHPEDGRSDVEIYRAAIETAVEAEHLGFDSVWTSEHHFVDDGYMPSQLPVLAAIAARTERILLGTGVLLAPLFHPLHVAEDAATVDLISGGRLILGLGIGWRDEEFAGFQDPGTHRGRRLEAMIEVLREAWSEGLARGDGFGIHRFPGNGLNVTPKPAQPGGPPIWIGAGARVAIERAGRVADGFMAGESPPAELAEQLAVMREAAASVGRDPSEVTPSVYRSVFAWRDGDAWELIRPYAHYGEWKYDDMADAHGSLERGLPPALTPEVEAALQAQMVSGTPEQVVEELAGYRDVLGAEGHLILRADYPGLDPAIARESLRILGEEVRPLLG
jgi:probable F420-dependent oxidoreductase